MRRGRGAAPKGPRHRSRDGGQVAIEYLGFLPILLLVALAGIQIGVVAYAAEQAGTAARAGARAASLREDAGAACSAAVSARVDVGCAASRQGDAVTVTATVHIPQVVPGWNLGDAHKSATMPLDH